MALVDTDVLESLLIEVDRLAVQLNGNSEGDTGLIVEIKDCVKCMEDAVAELGAAYDLENESSERFEKTRDELKSLIENFSSHLTDEFEKNKSGFRKTVSKLISESIKNESDKIVEKLTLSIKNELIDDVRSTSVKEVLGRNIEKGTQAELSDRIKELEARESIYRQHYDEASFWRRSALWLIAFFIPGAASIAILAILIFLYYSGSIEINY